MTGDPRDEVLGLRERVRVLAAGLGLDENFEVPAEVRRLARAGRSLHAIRELRRLTPAGWA